MCELDLSPDLLGSKVRNAARPEWGVGMVLRIQRTQSHGQSAHRVSIQFATGHRTLLVPPARLIAAGPEPERRAGWIDGLGKTTLDDRLRKLPDQVTQVFGSPRERLAAVLPLYDVGSEPAALLRWAGSQTGVRDPLSHWTRDELLVALGDFCNERDAYLRNVAALLKQKEGPAALQDVLDAIPAGRRQSVLAALHRSI